jgi:uncharacterized protein
MQAQRARLSNGRWHFQHGPIDIVIGAEGDATAVESAHESAWLRFETVLTELVGELPALRAPVRGPCTLRGVIACRMWLACRPYHSKFITSMAAVAGSVAQELVGCYERDGITRAWVNNGGDIALHLAPGASVKVGLFAELGRFDPASLAKTGNLPVDADFEVRADMPVRGIATSGWRGRSYSLGIADSVTALARTAAMADAAATVIANAVNIDDASLDGARIERRPASELKDDSDLGDTLVTVDVPRLSTASIDDALSRGRQCACELQREGLIHSAILVCQHRFVAVQALDAPAVQQANLELGSVFA